MEIENSPPRLHMGAGVIEHAIENAKELDHWYFGKQDRFHRKHRPGFESNAIYQTYRTQSEPIWIKLR